MGVIISKLTLPAMLLFHLIQVKSDKCPKARALMAYSGNQKSTPRFASIRLDAIHRDLYRLVETRRKTGYKLVIVIELYKLLSV